MASDGSSDWSTTSRRVYRPISSLVIMMSLAACSHNAESVQDCIDVWNQSPPDSELTELEGRLPEGTEMVVSFGPDDQGGTQCVYSTVGLRSDWWQVWRRPEGQWAFGISGLQTPSGEPANASIVDGLLRALDE